MKSSEAIEVVPELEHLSVKGSEVWVGEELLQVGSEEEELLVIRPLYVRTDRYSIIQLITEGHHGIINDNQIFQLSVLYYAKVFNIRALRRLLAVLPIQAPVSWDQLI